MEQRDPSEPPVPQPWEGDDEALIRAAQGGDEGALDELYVRTCDRLEAYVNRISGARLLRHVVSEDVLQDTYVRVFRVLDSLRPEANVEDFWRILRRNALWVVRNQGARHGGKQGESALGAGSPADLADGSGDRTGTVTRRDEASWLQSQLDEIDSGHGEVVRRRMKQEAFNDIALQVGISEEAARQRYSRAIRDLREKFISRRRDG